MEKNSFFLLSKLGKLIMEMTENIYNKHTFLSLSNIFYSKHIHLHITHYAVWNMEVILMRLHLESLQKHHKQTEMKKNVLGIH
jgi:hypothetical protein